MTTCVNEVAQKVVPEPSCLACGFHKTIDKLWAELSPLARGVQTLVVEICMAPRFWALPSPEGAKNPTESHDLGMPDTDQPEVRGRLREEWGSIFVWTRLLGAPNDQR